MSDPLEHILPSPFPLCDKVMSQTKTIPSTGSSHIHVENLDSAIPLDSEAADSEDEVYLSNKHRYCDVVLTKNQLGSPCQFDVPADFLPELPCPSVPVDLRCGGKNWNMMCSWNGGNLNFCSGWEIFVNDNGLKCGDACVFELRESSELKMKFKVVILRNELPRELRDVSLSCGESFDNPIDLE